MAIDRAMDFSFINEEVQDLYHPNQGRPSCLLQTLFRAPYLGIWANLSDAQLSQHLRFNVLFRWFCRIGWDDPVPDDMTLVVLRRRLKASGVYERLLERLVEQAKAKGLLRAVGWWWTARRWQPMWRCATSWSWCGKAEGAWCGRCGG